MQSVVAYNNEKKLVGSSEPAPSNWKTEPTVVNLAKNFLTGFAAQKVKTDLFPLAVNDNQ